MGYEKWLAQGNEVVHKVRRTHLSNEVPLYVGPRRSHLVLIKVKN